MRIVKTIGSDRLMPGTASRTGTHMKDFPDWVLYQQFNSNYYSGLDMSAYFDNIFMDEIVQLQFQEQEMTLPDFSYADYTFRGVTHGTRIVQGTFAINFKEGGYLKKLLAYLRDTKSAKQSLKTLSAIEARKNKEPYKVKDALDLKYLALKGDFTLEDYVNARDKVSSGGESTWEEYTDALDEAFWGEPTTLKNGYTVTLKDIQAYDPNFMTHSKFPTDEDGFDITLKWGQPEGDLGDTTNNQLPRWGTFEVIKNVHINGFSKAVDDSGKNVLEVYSFIASTVA